MALMSSKMYSDYVYTGVQNDKKYIFGIITVGQ